MSVRTLAQLYAEITDNFRAAHTYPTSLSSRLNDFLTNVIDSIDSLYAVKTSVGVEVVQTATPATGATVTMAAGKTALLVTPAATIAALTINLPAAPIDGQSVMVSSSQIVTALTLGGGTIVGAITALAVGGFARYVYNGATTSWYRVG